MKDIIKHPGLYAGFESLKASAGNVSAILRLMDGSVELTCVFDTTKPVHQASLHAKGAINYGLTMSVRPDQAQRICDTPEQLQEFMIDWLDWFCKENMIHDAKNYKYWSALAEEVHAAQTVQIKNA